jgi:hypothetical protein
VEEIVKTGRKAMGLRNLFPVLTASKQYQYQYQKLYLEGANIKWHRVFETRMKLIESR